MSKATNKIVVRNARGAKLFAGRPERFLEFTLPPDAGSEQDEDLTLCTVDRIDLMPNGDVNVYVSAKENFQERLDDMENQIFDLRRERGELMDKLYEIKRSMQ